MNGTTRQDLVITRDFDAPRELVYRAFVDPDQLAAWFGPVGYSVPRDSVSVEQKTGGHYRFTMVSDSDPSQTSPVNATFSEVIENELLVGSEEWAGAPGLAEGETMKMTMRLEFHDLADEGQSGRTRLVLRQGPYDPELENMARAGWNSSFTKLDGLLAG
jgi:uncharacterized protein YndB with AHSA1/START domain